MVLRRDGIFYYVLNLSSWIRDANSTNSAPQPRPSPPFHPRAVQSPGGGGYVPGRGFTFPDDAAVQYTFRTLHQIIGCMESGALLVLLDLRRLYGTLYDARAPATPVWGQGMKGGLRHTLSSAIPFGCVPLVSGHTSIDNAIYLTCSILVSGLDPPPPAIRGRKGSSGCPLPC